MKVYRYSTSGLYLGEAEAEESLLENGKYLMPTNSTSVPPPECDEGQCAVFCNGSWECRSMEADSFLEMDGIFELPDHEEEKRIARENLSVIVEILEIETLEQHRAVREFVLTGDPTRLAQIEAKIDALRRQLL